VRVSLLGDSIAIHSRFALVSTQARNTTRLSAQAVGKLNSPQARLMSLSLSRKGSRCRDAGLH
jgi:hypothetical protein